MGKDGRPGRDWEAFAQERGHKNLRAMLKDLYQKQKIRGRALAKALQCSHIRALQLMEACGIPRLPAGGAFVRKGEYKLKDVPDDVIMKYTPKEIAEDYKVHITTARRMKRLVTARVEGMKALEEKEKKKKKPPVRDPKLRRGNRGVNFQRSAGRPDPEEHRR